MSEKPFDRLLIEIGTDTGDLSKTIKELEKLQRMGSKGGSSFSGLRQFIEDAVTDAMRKGAKRGADGGGFKDFLQKFEQESNFILKELTGMFGPKRTTTSTSLKLMGAKAGIGKGHMLSSLVGSQQWKDSIQTVASELNMRPELLAVEAVEGLAKTFAFGEYGIGIENTKMQELMTSMMNKGYQGLSEPSKIKMLRQVAIGRSERQLKAVYTSQMRELHSKIGREVPFVPMKKEASLDPLRGLLGGKAGDLIDLLQPERGVVTGVSGVASLKTFGGDVESFDLGGVTFNAQGIRDTMASLESGAKTKSQKQELRDLVKGLGEARYVPGRMSFGKIFDVVKSTEDAENFLKLMEFAGTEEQKEKMQEYWETLLSSGRMGEEWKTEFKPGDVEGEITKFTKEGFAGGSFVAPEYSEGVVQRILDYNEAHPDAPFVPFVPKESINREAALNARGMMDYWSKNKDEMVKILDLKASGAATTKEVQEGFARMQEIMNGFGAFFVEAGNTAIGETGGDSLGDDDD